ncbi:hydrogenase maturation nickel metallochaperone HypA [Clostridium chromiireducens]|uniref:Hydrogenase maturation factor HypA n=1 Tax=Clostridium chromiireducens TaxID=225345 RepID=A0A399IU12_9CLOT|nr:hydrogenase maturation nickel metallochaperone HypA [Clostridium chromiireducens]RII36533.1 hydrogenase maturation nickel metallochaperone HypA [Clostridium chromiireducens]
MHEVSIINGVIDIVLEKARENKLKNINKITLKIGDFSGVMKDSLMFAFQSASKETALDNTELIIERVKATGECSNCNIIFEIEHFNKLCPKCNEFCCNILTGYELYIDTIDGDEYDS